MREPLANYVSMITGYTATALNSTTFTWFMDSPGVCGAIAAASSRNEGQTQRDGADYTSCKILLSYGSFQKEGDPEMPSSLLRTQNGTPNFGKPLGGGKEGEGSGSGSCRPHPRSSLWRMPSGSSSGSGRCLRLSPASVG